MDDGGEWPEKTGYLLKMGNNVMGSFDWKRRWIVIKDNGVLYYYKNKNDSSPAGRIILKDCQVKPNKGQKPHSMQLAIQGRTYFFAAENKVEYEEWMGHMDKKLVEQTLRSKKTAKEAGGGGSSILCGWLHKMGNNALKDWPKRWCVLTSESLTYWRKQEDPSGPAGVIKLASLHVAHDTDRPNCLELVTPGRCYYFQAEDTNTVVRWAKALDTCCRDIRQRLGEDVLSAMESEDLHAKRVVLRSQKSGFLGKAGKNLLHAWPKRYVVLRDDLLYYYKTQNDDKPLGIINLMLCTTRPNIPDKKFEIILPTRTYYFQCETHEEIQQWTEAITSAHDRVFDDLEANTSKLMNTDTNPNNKKYQTGLSMNASTVESDMAASGTGDDNLGDSKVESEEAKDRLLGFVKQPGNNICADCGENDPRWASINLGIFICITCSGVHRSMGVHISKVRSVDMDKWSEDCVNFMCSWGNTRFNTLWEKHLGDHKKPTKDANPNVKKEFILAKYQEKQFHEESGGKKVATTKKVDRSTFYKEGYLTKQGNSVKTWKKRWFELKTTGNSASLYYYKCKGDKMPAGVIPLLQAHVASGPAAQKLAFEIMTPQRTFVITGATEPEKRDWMEHLNMVIQSFPPDIV
eukprot:CAMPEP_0201517988 /NCGR_PEP_ID=MMETSP0161_2-20130828/8943_1 /ASSEMBLY_ACC=CAM_ASM_000251 /TAXON_ID=180227 /ORGANISM="Neoparamoeba aestuarina, Strain SoJaBio B1-5/56/2" /LENGTH=631 /DNA_ID=CAMNT_0047915631 /DNA_START=265 /DNA_END=2160 /DNA_ORIENTATION=+